ncbi:MAG: hypothetical protein LBM68_02990 [Bacteroidales bacterium]|jgi:hypothetical protein|nr:hypothetical protein [Bacteroidales bacterium]
MKELFFITTTSVAPKNKKAQAAVEFCKRYHHALACDRISIDSILAELKLLCKKLNEADTRSKEITVSRTNDCFTLHFVGALNEYVFQLRFTKVQKIYQFNELIPVVDLIEN